MANTSSVGIKVNFQGDVIYDQQFNAASNTSSPASNEVQELVSGNNTINVPEGATGVTIIPPEDNDVVLNLKGVNADTGVTLGLTDPTFITLGAASPSSFVLNVSDDVTLRFIWS